MQRRNCLASCPFVGKLFERTHDHPAMSALAIRTVFSPSKFPDSGFALPFRANHTSILHFGCPFHARFGACENRPSKRHIQAQTLERIPRQNTENRTSRRKVIALQRRCSSSVLSSNAGQEGVLNGN